MAEQTKHLYYINELSDYKIADGYPDIRGWDVKDIDNRVIGKVDNLLVNKAAERVVYLDIEVDQSIIDAKYDPYGRPSNTELREFVNKDGENHIIIPIGLVDLNEDSNYVYTDMIDHRTFSETKRYRKGDSISRNYENQVLDSYSRKQNLKHDNNDRDLYKDEDRLREIIRDEIRKYHYDTDKNVVYGTSEAFESDDIDEAVIITDEEMEMRRRSQNDDVFNEDNFYERREFDDKDFNRRTPGL